MEKDLQTSEILELDTQPNGEIRKDFSDDDELRRLGKQPVLKVGGMLVQ